MTWRRSPPSSRASRPCTAGADKDRFEHSREHTDRAPDNRRAADDNVKVTRWVATIAGLIGFLLSVATPLLPVVQTTAT